MGRHTIPAGAFFTYSPDLSFRCPSSQDDTVLEAIRWTEERKEKGGEMNCFLRSSSNEERDGHLARLLGVQRMHALLLVLQDNAKVKYYGKLKASWYKCVGGHPCNLLQFNDKWYMIYQDEKHLNRYGNEKRQELSCIPQQLQDGIFSKYAVEACLYCNGSYDAAIQKTLGLDTGGIRNTKGPWTEQCAKERPVER